MVWGVEVVITANLRGETKSESIAKAVRIMWQSIEREGILNRVDESQDLSIVLIAGSKGDVKKYMASRGERELNYIPCE